LPDPDPLIRGTLKVTDEKRRSRIQIRIRIRIWIRYSKERIWGSASVPKCHGSGTLLVTLQYLFCRASRCRYPAEVAVPSERAGPISRSASGSVSQRKRSEDPDPHPDPYQDVTDPEHCFSLLLTLQYCISAAEHPDAGIQRKSLSLLSVLATRTNVKSVVDTILNYLRRTDNRDPAIVDKVILYVVIC
jgi:hypothetical protein